MVKPLGRQAAVESGTQRLEAEARDSPATATMETGRPAELAPYRWWAEGEQRGCQTTALEEAGTEGGLVIFEPPGSQGCTLEQKHSLGSHWELKPTPGWTWGHKPSLGWTLGQKPSQA